MKYIVTSANGSKHNMDKYDTITDVQKALSKIENEPDFSEDTTYQVWIEKNEGDWKTGINCPCIIWSVANSDVTSFNLPAGSKWKTKKTDYTWNFFTTINDIII